MMPDSTPPTAQKTTISPQVAAQKKAREARLIALARENLKKRKAWQRARAKKTLP